MKQRAKFEIWASLDRFANGLRWLSTIQTGRSDLDVSIAVFPLSNAANQFGGAA
jgi:hypothetical protein